MASPPIDLRADLSVRCAAKINWFLNIGKCRDDGYHELQTVMQLVDLYDRLYFILLAEDRVELDDPGRTCGCPHDENIVVRAARELKRRFGVRHGVRVAIEKRIPVRAGLGGGSSDAAAALRALVSLWELPAGEGELREVARLLGADVPFFLGSAAALCEGVGERVTTITPRERHVVLWNPRAGLSTREVYQRFDIVPRPVKRAEPFLYAYECGDTVALAGRIWNNLAFAAEECMPALKAMQDKCLELGARAAWVSGSGPTVVSLCVDEASARELAVALRRHAGDESFIHAGRTLTAAPNTAISLVAGVGPRTGRH